MVRAMYKHTGPEVIKLFFMLNSAEHEICHDNKSQISLNIFYSEFQFVYRYNNEDNHLGSERKLKAYLVLLLEHGNKAVIVLWQVDLSMTFLSTKDNWL